MEIEGLFAVAAAVLTISALLAGFVARAPLSFPIVFLALGLVLGDGTTGALSVDLDSEVLQAVAFATLALVLFLDAMNLELAVMRRDWLIPALTLGPGTLLVIGLTAVSAMVIMGLDPLIAFIVGAILASTDPVVLRDVLRDDRLPRPVRNALSIEGGTNDLIVLPPILILAAVATHEASSTLSWLGFLGELLIVGPVAGAAVGLGGAWLMSAVDARYPVRREWQALYGIGLVLAAFAAGETLGEDGFLAAFAAGAAVGLSSRTLCDCFLEFGEVLAELLMLMSFVLFGAVLSSELGSGGAGRRAALGGARGDPDPPALGGRRAEAAPYPPQPRGASVHRVVRPARPELAAARAAGGRARRRGGQGGLRHRGRGRARLGGRARRDRHPALELVRAARAGHDPARGAREHARGRVRRPGRHDARGGARASRPRAGRPARRVRTRRSSSTSGPGRATRATRTASRAR